MAPRDAQYDACVSDVRSPADQLSALLQQLRLQAPRADSPSDAAQAHMDLLLDRLATLTSAVRAADTTELSRVGARVLLADVATTAAELRGHASAHAATLTRVIDSVREILDRTGEGSTPV
jgi:hypothetical protein